jgi:hypothetical protein
MTSPEAEAILSMFFANFSHPPIEPVTIAVYAKHIEPLGYEQCLEAVDMLVRSPQHFRPTVGEILEVYRSLHDKYAPPALREPPMTEEQRRENLRQAQALVNRLAAARTMPTEEPS